MSVIKRPKSKVVEFDNDDGVERRGNLPAFTGIGSVAVDTKQVTKQKQKGSTTVCKTVLIFGYLNLYLFYRRQ